MSLQDADLFGEVGSRSKRSANNSGGASDGLLWPSRLPNAKRARRPPASAPSISTGQSSPCGNSRPVSFSTPTSTSVWSPSAKDTAPRFSPSTIRKLGRPRIGRRPNISGGSSTAKEVVDNSRHVRQPAPFESADRARLCRRFDRDLKTVLGRPLSDVGCVCDRPTRCFRPHWSAPSAWLCPGYGTSAGLDRGSACVSRQASRRLRHIT
jgi:hypothetical protein